MKCIYQHRPFVSLFIYVLFIIALCFKITESFADDVADIALITIYGIVLLVVLTFLFFTDFVAVLFNPSERIVVVRRFSFNSFRFRENRYELPIQFIVSKKGAGRESLCRILLVKDGLEIPLTRANVISSSNARNIVLEMQRNINKIQDIL